MPRHAAGLATKPHVSCCIPNSTGVNTINVIRRSDVMDSTPPLNSLPCHPALCFSLLPASYDPPETTRTRIAMRRRTVPLR